MIVVMRRFFAAFIGRVLMVNIRRSRRLRRCASSQRRGSNARELSDNKESDQHRHDALYRP
jgi:hypothetical protein